MSASPKTSAERPAARARTNRPARPAAAPRRRQGRPATAEAAVGRERVIAAARELLRTTKPARLTIEAVARHAGVDARLVRYYVGDRAALHHAVIESLLREREAERARLEAIAPPAAQLAARLASTLAMFVADPHYHELVVEEVFQGDDRFAQGVLADFVDGAYPPVRRMVEAGVAAGDFAPVDPRFVYLALFALPEFLVTARPLVEGLFGRPLDARLAAQFRAFAERLLVRGLAP